MKKEIYNAIENISPRRTDLPKIKVGEIVEVVYQNIISDISRKQFSKKKKDNPIIQNIKYRGIVIFCKRRNSISQNFRLLKEDAKSSMTFFYHSPLIIDIKIIGREIEKVRRSKLFYLGRRIENKNK